MKTFRHINFEKLKITLNNIEFFTNDFQQYDPFVPHIRGKKPVFSSLKKFEHIF